ETGTFGAQGDVPSFAGLLLAGSLAVVVAGLLYVLVNRDIGRTLSGKQPAGTSDPVKGDRQANTVVVGVFVALLIVGALVWNGAVNGVTPFEKDGFRGSYPATFGTATAEGDVLRVVDNLGTGAEFAVATRALEAGQDAKAIASQLGGERSTDYALYKVTESSNVNVSGKTALMQRFSLVDAQGLSGALPQVMEGIDYVFIESGRAVVVTLLSPSDSLADVEPVFARFLNGLSF
ncbi:MAG TPA: hypothetical protein VJ754_05350, partial [Anaerolineae bacterium]|nr:hypothetical protein [Anaerolineae bacterium]